MKDILSGKKTLLTFFPFSQLRTTMEESTALFDKEKAQERLSKLSGGVAVFKVRYSSFWIPAVFSSSIHAIKRSLTGWGS